MSRALREERAASSRDGRYATPEEVADLMLYLASDLASHVTGQSVQINGGSHSRGRSTCVPTIPQ